MGHGLAGGEDVLFFSRYLRDQFKSASAFSVATLVFSVAYVWLYRVMIETTGVDAIIKILERMGFMKSFFMGRDPDISTFTGFLRATAFGGVIMMFIIAYAGLSSAQVVARDIDRRTIDFVLSLPVSRRRICLQRIAGYSTLLAVPVGAQLMGLWIATSTSGQYVSVGRLATAAVMAYLAVWVVGAVLFMLSLLFTEYSRAASVAVGAGLLLYLVSLLIEPGSPASFIRLFSPFAYLDYTAALDKGTVPYATLVSLLALGVLLWVIGSRVFERRQV